MTTSRASTNSENTVAPGSGVGAHRQAAGESARANVPGRKGGARAGVQAASEPSTVKSASVSVVIPTLNEEATISRVIQSVKPHLESGMVCEIVVIDADSTDRTVSRAQASGARVINWREPIRVPTRAGKGESLWRAVAATSGEIIVFIDGDVTNPNPNFVPELVRALENPEVMLVKADYERHGEAGSGGRVTELTAKPLLSMYFPELEAINQPLAGEYALRREFAESTAFPSDYGVEVALLIDCLTRYGAQAISQVSFPPRSHRNRPLSQLGPMARQVARALLCRAGALPRPFGIAAEDAQSCAATGAGIESKGAREGSGSVSVSGSVSGSVEGVFAGQEVSTAESYCTEWGERMPIASLPVELVAEARLLGR